MQRPEIGKILVPVKRVIDPCVAIRIKGDGTGVETAGVRMSMNPFDEIAVEAAVRVKESGAANEIIAVSCGVSACAETLRTALAMGADRAILIETGIELQPLAVARVLVALCQQELPNLVICGKQAIDSDAGQTGTMLAALLGWPLATRVSHLNVSEGQVLATCETDDGCEVWQLRLPALLTVELGLNTPRYVTLPNLMKAKKKPLDTLRLEALGVDVGSRLAQVSISAPPPRRAGVRVADIGELIRCLRDEARVL